jgi:hypothetical protein
MLFVGFDYANVNARPLHHPSLTLKRLPQGAPRAENN